LVSLPRELRSCRTSPPSFEIVSAELSAAVSTSVIRQITVASTAISTLSADVASMRLRLLDWIF
jgi:hypothetical protein